LHADDEEGSSEELTTLDGFESDGAPSGRRFIFEAAKFVIFASKINLFEPPRCCLNWIFVIFKWRGFGYHSPTNR